ncbi:MAG: hypothetical protein COV52_02545 [Gammaproteobacteria bacterium CG11_big_fil_rev_8_21_14_0_20_46_22]|nr:MAG: hypothetical protein COW05_08585 [Gammaproteobacteria bacterium CG12_big_fil_rev_8_21_14_0_65_46_12]PIR11660.1 MAG: hypothetical protein COV52_02545 [Gammaproteobacteria bacterium CG11_big_fil_rev_8_21_14_0_20_46_22]
MKHATLGALLCCAPVLSLALTCPSALQIRQGDITPFVALDTNDDEPVGQATFKRFQAEVNDFHRAEWLPKVAYASQCYYRLKEPPYYSEVSLASTQDQEPVGPYWHFEQSSHTRKVCEASEPSDCQF